MESRHPNSAELFDKTIDVVVDGSIANLGQVQEYKGGRLEKWEYYEMGLLDEDVGQASRSWMIVVVRHQSGPMPHLSPVLIVVPDSPRSPYATDAITFPHVTHYDAGIRMNLGPAPRIHFCIARLDTSLIVRLDID